MSGENGEKGLVVHPKQYEKALALARELNASSQHGNNVTVRRESRSLIPAVTVLSAVGIVGALIAGAAAAFNTSRHNRPVENSVTPDEKSLVEERLPQAGSTRVIVEVTLMRVDVVVRSTTLPLDPKSS